MKKGLHPNYELCEIRCACGNVIKTKTTKKNMEVEICSACHPFFTGQQKFINRGGRVEKFKNKYNMD